MVSSNKKSFIRMVSLLATLGTSLAFSLGPIEIQSTFESLNHALPHINSAAHALPHARTAASTLHHGGFDPLSTYKELLKVHPLPTKMITGATLAVCGDAIAQSKVKETDYDKQRASSFAIFDMAYRALQHFAFPVIVATCHGQYLGSLPGLGVSFDASQLAAMEQALASQLGIVPFLYYPAFFALTGAIQGLTPSGAMMRAKDNFLPLMKRNLLFWIPVQFIQFGYIQEDLQIPFLSVCGLAWTFILSMTAGNAKTYTAEKEVEKAMLANTQASVEEATVVHLPALAALEEEEEMSVVRASAKPVPPSPVLAEAR
ncbi:Mpv17 / PMP22 family protein [Nitzschia inconspicua]|uniref:Mpv17 / PMP22 family protein n=1 Tax=Nitzschia inconspicua TaxID=303405 RepID=A0A9K3LUD5_9STRA|nr:Mpv17 / PMP22 family protein [Nitzschia inconspicua]